MEKPAGYVPATESVISPIPPAMNKSDIMFQKMMMEGSILAGLAHAAFCYLFYINDVTILTYFNIGSVLCYLFSFLLTYRNRTMVAWMLIITEVTTHAVLATVIVGWKCYFQLHLLLLLPVVVVTNLRRWQLKVPILVIIMIIFLWLDYNYQPVSPPFTLDQMTVIFLRRFNQLTFMIFLVIINAMHFLLVLRGEHELIELASTDPLTGLRNRRSIINMSSTETSRQRRYGRPLSFLMCDIDHFKSINDTYGHECGDEVIKALAGVLMKGVRDLDHAVRWGGEEFLLLLPETPLAGAQLVAERLRKKIESLRIPVNESDLSVTMTVGISTLQTGETLELAINRADNALYLGKRAGRNRVEIAPEDIQAVQA